MFFIGTAQFPLPFRCVLSFGRAAVAVPRGRYAVRSGVRFAAFGGAVRRTFRSGFRTGQGQRVLRRVSVSGARGRAGGAAVIPVPANAWAWLYGAARGKGRPAVPFRRIGVRSWPKRFSCAVRGGRGLLETGFPGRVSPGVRGTRSFPQTVLLRPAPRFVMPGRRTPFVAGPYRAARSGAPAAPDRRVKRPVPSFGSCVSGPAGRSVSRTGAGERQGEGRDLVFLRAGRRNADRFAKGIIFAPYRNRSAESKMKRLFAYIVWSCLLFAALWHSGSAFAPSEGRSDGGDVRCESLCEACGLHEWYRLVAESWQSDVPPLAAGVHASFAAAAVPRLLCRGRDVVQAVPPRLFLTEHPAVRLDVQRRDRDRMRAGLARSGHYVLALRKIVV